MYSYIQDNDKEEKKAAGAKNVFKKVKLSLKTIKIV